MRCAVDIVIAVRRCRFGLFICKSAKYREACSTVNGDFRFNSNAPADFCIISELFLFNFFGDFFALVSQCDLG